MSIIHKLWWIYYIDELKLRMTDAISCIISPERNNMQVLMYFHNGERIWPVVIEMWWSETKKSYIEFKTFWSGASERTRVCVRENEREGEGEWERSGRRRWIYNSDDCFWRWLWRVGSDIKINTRVRTAAVYRVNIIKYYIILLLYYTRRVKIIITIATTISAAAAMSTTTTTAATP